MRQAGLDVKYWRHERLTWDFTVNTDFSQVEADEQQVNLTLFSLFFPEKRDFFLENSGIFQFGQGRGVVFGGGGLTSGRQTDAILFFRPAHRTLGQRRIDTDRWWYAADGRLGAYKRWRAQHSAAEGNTSAATNFSALRLRRNVLSNSDVGLIMLNKDERGSRFNRVVGADANFRFFNSLDLNASVARTMSPAAVGRRRQRVDGQRERPLPRPALGAAKHLRQDRRTIQRRDGVRAADGRLEIRQHVRRTLQARGCRSGCESCSRISGSPTCRG
jgi:hypothetical protein